MKTECLKKEIEMGGMLSNRIKFKITTATDIWSIEIYKKGWFGWRRIAYTWDFYGTAKKLLSFLKDWLD